jgi:hypothetical protein
MTLYCCENCTLLSKKLEIAVETLRGIKEHDRNQSDSNKDSEYWISRVQGQNEAWDAAASIAATALEKLGGEK